MQRVGGNITRKLVSQQGYTTPAHLRSVHVYVVTAQTQLAECLFYM